MNAYVKGQSVRLSASFTNPDGAAYDPGTVTITYKAPASASVSKVYGQDAEVMRDGLGKYHMDIIVTAAGEWYYRTDGAGGGQAAAEDAFYVSETEV